MNEKTKLFLEEIESLVREYKIEYMDAIVLYCERNSVEIESVTSIIKNNEYMKSRIQIEAEAVNLLPKTSRLPI